MLPRLTGDTAAMLRSALLRAGYDTDGVRELLGPAAHAAIGRGEPVAAWVEQREDSDPALYVGRWLSDSGTDPRSPAGNTAAELWLELLDTVFVVTPDVRLERSSAPGAQGWVDDTPVLHRTSGPGRRHETDERGAALLAGCTGVLPLGELVGLLAAAHDEPTGPMTAAALPVVRELVRHGMLRPAGGAP